MPEVVCNHCGRDANVSPDSTLCPACRTDLVDLLSVSQISEYFHTLTTDLALEGNLDGARQMVARGLAYRETSDLHLLAALLARQAGDHDGIRRHVAAISVDDVLREEAEWLLRSSSGTMPSQFVAFAPTAHPVAAQTTAQQAEPSEDSARFAGRRRYVGSLIMFVLVVIVLVIGLDWVSSMLFDAGGDAVMQQSPTASQLSQVTATVAPVAEVSESTNGDVAAESQTAVPSASATPTLAPASPDLTPQPAQVVGTPMARDGAVTALDGAEFDLTAYLSTLPGVGLVADEVSTQVFGERLVLEGVISTAEERNRLIEVVAGAPGVEEVEASGLYLRPPLTYTVQVGDSLWSIAAQIYGDSEFMDTIIQLNSSLLASPDNLSAGAILELPPID